MINNGYNGIVVDNSSVNNGDREQNLNMSRSHTVQRGETGKDYMEMEGRVYSELYRNTSEDMFIRTFMEGSVGIPAPTMEMLDFKSLSNNFRADSEELFKSWLTTGENQGHNSTSVAHNRPRQLSRMFTDQASHQNEPSTERKRSNENLIPKSSLTVGESSNGLNDYSIRNVAEKGLQASNLYLAKAWFNSSQPMTRSRSSELRKRYVAMQNSQTSIGMEAMHNSQTSIGMEAMHNSSLGNGFNQLDGSQFGTIDRVSSLVGMLKNTLECKKPKTRVEEKVAEDCSLGYHSAQEIFGYANDIHIHGDLSGAVNKNPGLFQVVQGSMDADVENIVGPTNPSQRGIASGEPSQSESSTVAPVISAGFDACDGPSNSGPTQMPSVCESSRKQVGIRRNVEYDGGKGKAESGDSTKKRRVERSRKMAEAKERTQSPATSSDMQSILKRCENLEKEVRSLKLNLAFMNRKDSEQTKQIEELQKQHEEMRDEKERLLEEIDRILSDPR